MPRPSRSTVTVPSRPGTAISPSVCGNERRTRTTPATRVATSRSTSTTAAYVDHRPQRGQLRKPRRARGGPGLLADTGGGEDAAVSDTADIVPCSGAGTGPRPRVRARGRAGSLRIVSTLRYLAVEPRECQQHAGRVPSRSRGDVELRGG